MKSLKIVFMGTPDFAIPSLKATMNSPHNIELVVTQPDKPKGRGRKLLPPPVKICGLESGLKIAQPESINHPEFIEQIKAIKPDIIVVVAFGQLLKKELLDIPSLGTLNVHPSLLPKYRGPAPIQWSIINGNKETGVCIMLMDKGMDTGDVLLSEKTKIQPHETSGCLHDRLAKKGADLLIKAIEMFQTGKIQPIKQNNDLASYAPMLKKKDGKINWSDDSYTVSDLVRGVNPWPGAFTFWNKKRLKIFKGEIKEIDHDKPAGTILEGKPNELLVCTGKYVFSVLELQGESGKRLSVENFLRGNQVMPGTVLG